MSSIVPLIAYQHEDSDSATPRFPVPIIFLHTLEQPFCDTPRCECQQYKQQVQRLFAQAARGERILQIIDISQEVAQCESLGHELVTCTIADAKVCHICSVLAYCPDCTPEKPSPSAIPLLCTQHARSR